MPELSAVFWRQQEAWNRHRERAVMWIAWHVPRWLAYWCFIRVAAHATTGKWGTTVPHDLDVMESLRRWDEPN